MSTVKIYRKTATITAERFDGWMDTAQKYGIRIEPDKDLSGVAIDELVPRGKYYLPTLEGKLEIHQGDWIATGVNGEHWPIADEIFKKTYAELPVIPKIVADVIDHYYREYSLSLLFSDSNDEGMSEEFLDYFYEDGNPEIIARAWLDGYQIVGED